MDIVPHRAAVPGEPFADVVLDLARTRAGLSDSDTIEIRDHTSWKSNRERDGFQVVVPVTTFLLGHHSLLSFN